MKLTKAGLCFSGPTAFPSNMSRSELVFEGQDYTSAEQGIQHLNAGHHLVFNIAETILRTHEAKEIKKISHDIPKSEEWNKIAPTKLWELTDAKYYQNPELMEMLLDTAPYQLVEASIDDKWGGGAFYGSSNYDEGIVPGKNLFGNIATTY